jgi:uncharacterized membrane protein
MGTMKKNNDTYEERAEPMDNGPALFEAVLEPHRSLSPRGFLVLIAAVVMVSFIAGIAFVMIGAWPVFGFIGLDAVLIYVAFKVNFHSAKIYESVKLTEDMFLVERMRPNGQMSSWKFQPYWLRIAMEGGDSRLVVSSHGKSVIIGEFLTPSERIELADTLRAELDKLRTPRHQQAV